MTDETRGRLGRRLRRILLLLPYAIQNPGVSVDELSSRFGVKKRDLIDDLNLVFLCGLPGYGPGDLIDVAVDEDRVFVTMADYFSAPLRLTPAEALALYAGGQALAQTKGMEEADALRRALTKLGRALGADNEAEGESSIQVHVEPGAEAHFDGLSAAVKNRKRIHLEYFSASRGKLTEREVDPWGLVTALGRWYLVGWDHDSGEERMFRLDRVKALTTLEEAADVPSDFDPERYRGAFTGHDGQETVSFEISPRATQWFHDYYPVQKSETLPDGWTRVTLVVGGLPWAATLVLRLGRDARNAEPAALGDAARELARAIAARHA